MGKCTEQQFSKEEQMVKRHIKKCSISLAIIELQIKTTSRFQLQSEYLSSRSQTTINVDKDAGEKETLIHY
jgi:hypothetical protein